MLSVSPYKLILASSSPRRKSLLQEVALPYLSISPDVEEVPLSAEESAHEYVARLSLEKGQDVAQKLGVHLPEEVAGCLILSADTIVLIDHQILEKPGSEAEAREMLGKLAGRRHSVLTGMCLHQRHPNGSIVAVRQGGFETKVWMRELSQALIAAYVKTKEPMDKAGGYAIQGIGCS